MTTPMFSVVVPLFNSDPAQLIALLRSLQGQSWADFECIMIDDGSVTAIPTVTARSVAASDPRFRVSRRLDNRGIAETTNEAIAQSSGEWIVFCDHDDLVHPLAFESVALFHWANDELEIIYTDEELVDEMHERLAVHRKPDLSPERLLGQNYIAHLLAIRRRLLDRVALSTHRWLDPAFEPCQDNDLVLRATEAAEETGHLRVIRYSWRAGARSIASAPDRKSGVAEAVRRASSAALSRRGQDAVVEEIPTSPTTVRVHRPIPPGAQVVEIAVSIDDLARDVDRAIGAAGVAADARAASFVALVPRVHQQCHGLGPGGASLARPLDPAVAQAARAGIAGARVVTTDGRLLSAGRHHTPLVRDLDQGEPANAPGPLGAFLVARECASLSPLGLVVRADLLEMLGGFCVRALGSDCGIDAATAALCLRALEAGFQPIWTPLTTFVVSEDQLDTPQRLARRDQELGGLAAFVDFIDPYDPFGVRSKPT